MENSIKRGKQMKRNAVHVTWELLKQTFGLEKIYATTINDYGILFHQYGGDIEHVEGACNATVEHKWTEIPEKQLLCDIDGNALCINRKGFINLAESPAVFIELTPEQIKEIEELRK